MSTEQNQVNNRRAFEEIWNQKNIAVIDELIDFNFVGHDSSRTLQGPEQFKQFVSMYLTAFPDAHFTIEDQIAEGDKVVTRYTARGTQQGPLMSILPTGKQSTVTGIVINRFTNGRVVEGWFNYDTLVCCNSLVLFLPWDRSGGMPEITAYSCTKLSISV